MTTVHSFTSIHVVLTDPSVPLCVSVRLKPVGHFDASAFVCMYVCIYICLLICVFVCMYVSMYVC